MKFALRLLALDAIALLSLAAPASAQYMYLDTNGDGVNTATDRMNANGTATVADVYLKTNQNRDGSTAECNTADGPLSMFSFIVNLQASGGTVTYSNYVNQQPTFSNSAQDFTSNSTEMTVGQFALAPLPAGSYRLCTVTITGQTGSAWVTPVPFTSLASAPCSFGTQCSGNDLDNTHQLGSDWFDVTGIGAGTDVGQGPVASMSVSGSGSLYLGGNDIQGPWRLEYFGKRLSVNGFTLPAEGPGALKQSLPTEEQAQLEFIDRAESLADSLRRSAVSTEVATERLRQFCASNGLGGLVDAEPGLVWLRFRSGASMYFTLKPVPLSPAIGTPSPPGRSEAARLEQLGALLQRGALIFILHPGAQFIVPAVRAEEVRAVIRKLRSGSSLDAEEEKLMPARIQAQLRSPTRLVRY